MFPGAGGVLPPPLLPPLRAPVQPGEENFFGGVPRQGAGRRRRFLPSYIPPIRAPVQPGEKKIFRGGRGRNCSPA